jgi:hypothetical protein
MRCLLFALLLGLISVASAADPEFRVGGELLRLRWLDKVSGILITQDCGEKKSCKALEAHMESQRPAEKSVKYPTADGINPGSLACRHRFSAEVFLATGRPGETQGFCRFQDKSIISLNGLNP